MIGLLFGEFWAFFGLLALPRRYLHLEAAAVLLVGLGLTLHLWRCTSRTPSRGAFFRTPAYILAVVLEVVALAGVSALLPRFGLAQYVYPAIGFIVGLHFAGLWRIRGSRRLLGIAFGMCLVSLVSVLLPFTWKSLEPRDAFLGLANALVLGAGASAGD